MDDQSISTIVTYGAGLGATLSGAVVGGYLVWQVIVGHLGFGKGQMGQLDGALGRLRGEISDDVQGQMRNLEAKVLRRIDEVRNELTGNLDDVKRNLQTVKTDQRENKRESESRFSDLERSPRRR